MMEAFYKRRIKKIRGSDAEEAEDLIAVEKRLRILVNGRHVLSLSFTPLMVREFVVGVIFSEGLISGEWCAERMSMVYGDEITVDVPSAGTLQEGERTVTSGCAGGVSMSWALPGRVPDHATTFRADDLRQAYTVFQKKAEGYRLTGGLHSAAITDGRSIVVFAEDIGRHNAVDKVIGACILEGIPFEGTAMLASGRLSAEIVSKCARCGIPVVVSRAAPTSRAVEIAEAAGITLVGFLRGERMNMYSGSARVRLEREDLAPDDNDLEGERGKLRKGMQIHEG